MRRTKGISEDVPTNSAGAGNVDGIGVGPRGEPGGKAFIMLKGIIKRRGLANAKGDKRH